MQRSSFAAFRSFSSILPSNFKLSNRPLATMASKLTLQSTYKMNSGHSIPVLGYGVSELAYDEFMPVRAMLLEANLLVIFTGLSNVSMFHGSLSNSPRRAFVINRIQTSRCNRKSDCEGAGDWIQTCMGPPHKTQAKLAVLENIYYFMCSPSANISIWL